MAYTLVESYLYACPKVGYARNRSRTACFNEGFLKQAILSSKWLADKRVDRHAPRCSPLAVVETICEVYCVASIVAWFLIEGTIYFTTAPRPRTRSLCA